MYIVVLLNLVFDIWLLNKTMKKFRGRGSRPPGLPLRYGLDYSYYITYIKSDICRICNNYNIMLLNRLVSTIILQDSEYVRSKLLEKVISQLEKDIVKSEMDGGKYDAAARYGPQMKTTEREPTGSDYDDAASNGPNAVPSIRDNEYVQHGTLWGAQYMSGTFNVRFLSIYSLL